jgi:hypothetical protein
MKKSNLREWIYDVLKEGGYEEAQYGFYNILEFHFIHIVEINHYLELEEAIKYNNSRIF